MLKIMFPNLHTLANVCMTLPVGTASVERSMKILIESPQKLTDEDLETMIEIWSIKTRRIVV